MTINNSVAMLRTLRQFFDQRLGLNAWDRVKIKHFGQHEDDTHEYVEIEFTRNGKTFSLFAIAPDDAPPLGKIEYRENGNRGSIVGPISDSTFNEIHDRLMAA